MRVLPLFLIIVFGLFYSCSECCRKANDIKCIGLKGKVRSLKTSYFHESNRLGREKDRTVLRNTVIDFNREGMISASNLDFSDLQFFEFHPCLIKGETSRQEVENNLIEELIKHVVFKRDIKKGPNDPGNNEFNNTLLFDLCNDSKGNIISLYIYDHDRLLRARSTFNYDEKQKLINRNTTVFDSIQTLTYTYDEKNNLIGFIRNYNFSYYDISEIYRPRYFHECKKKFICINTNLFKNTDESTFKYDENKKYITEWKLIKQDYGDIYTYTNHYNKKGFLVKKLIEYGRYDRTRLSFEKTVYNYDKNGNLIEEDIQGRGVNTARTFTYEFDKKKNWVKKTIYENGLAVMVVEREIEYY